MDVNLPNFVHLHVHTQYSLLDGAIRIDDLYNKVKSYNMKSIAITDHGTMFGVLDFYKKGINIGIKPIIGCECYLAPRAISDKSPMDRRGTRHIVLLAKNKQGYENLCKLVTISQLKGFYYKPRIDKYILSKYCKGLICLSACLNGEIPQLILSKKANKIEDTISFYSNLFGDGNFFLEIQKNGIKLQDNVNYELLRLSKRFSIPLVATNDSHYLESGDAKAHEILLCIQTRKTINDKDRFVFDSDQLYLKSPNEMISAFSDFPDATDNSVKIANQCNVDFDLKTYHFPNYDINNSTDVLFEEQVRIGYSKRLKIINKFKENCINLAKYNQRLEYELKTIKKMGFSGYFLIVADFVNYARREKIAIGPGRGSAAGSLVSYSLGITDLDPIEHGLLFERFLNPDRISMPDIDIDFCIHGRERVYDYVVERYGEDRVAQIITFGKMKARMVIRDVGKALGIPFLEVDAIAKLIPEGLDITINTAIKSEPRLSKKINSKSNYDELIKISMALEGLFRHASTHAAGVVISDKALVEYLPLYKGKKGEIVTQFDMKNVEDIGLIKFDFLGLRNLTVIEETLKIIEHVGKKCPDLSSLDFCDSKTYELLQRGDTTGVFQLESSGMKQLMINLKPENFNEIIALVALYRPGPLDSGMVKDFIERKHGRKKVKYEILELEPILKETYGVMVYQEQVMQVAVSLSGYSMADADSLRKAISKKKNFLMGQHREKFINGILNKGISVNKANRLFDLIEKFGGYGFNKSHSAAYALITYRTAYLKTHYPIEFMTALLNSEIENIDGVFKFIDQCRKYNIDVLPPDINKSNRNFVVDNNQIRVGLAAIKNVGGKTVDAIIKERQERGLFKSIFNFCQRVDLTKVNKRVLESLICCGAFDSTMVERSRLMAVLEEVLNYGQRFQKERDTDQMSLFTSNIEAYAELNQPIIPVVDDWDCLHKLKFEKDLLGFYLTGHPLDKYSYILEKLDNDNTASLKNKENNSSVVIPGTIDSFKTIRTKKGKLMGFLTLGDTYGKVEIIIFSSIYSKCSKFIIDNEIILIKGKVRVETGDIKILADSMTSIKNIENFWKIELHFIIDQKLIDISVLPELRCILDKYPGSCSGFLHVKLKKYGEIKISMSNSYGINCCEKMISEVNNLLQYDAVKIHCLPL